MASDTRNPVPPRSVQTVPGAIHLELKGFDHTKGKRAWNNYYRARQTVEFDDTNLYNIKPVILQRGPFAGCKALILQEISFSFMDLPPEVRNEIYKYLLIHQRPFAIRRLGVNDFINGDSEDDEDDRFTRGFLTPAGIKRYHSRVHRYTGTSLSDTHASLRLDLQLLTLNSTIHEEVSAVLYSDNSFVISSRDVMPFFESIGEHKQYFRRIMIHDMDISAGKTAGSRIKQIAAACPGLRTITLQHSTICGSECTANRRKTEWPGTLNGFFGQHASTLRTLLKSLTAQRGDHDSILTLSKLLNVAPDLVGICAKHNSGCPWMSKCAVYNETLEHCDSVNKALHEVLFAELTIIDGRRQKKVKGK